MSRDAEITTLTFSPDNPCNTTITSSEGDVLYNVVTEITKKTTYTQVRDADDEVIASLEWREMLSDRVTIGDRRPVPFSDWMKKSMIPFKEQVSFVDEQGRKYRWKGIGSGRSVELYSDHDNFSVPIARYHRSRRMLDSSQSSSDPEKPSAGPMASQYSLTPTLTDAQSITPTLTDARSVASVARPRVVHTPGQLALLPRALEIRDLVVLSLLFIEKQQRTQGGGASDNAMVGMNSAVRFAVAC
ncbi:hypothetical protein PsYK624_107340 [Phanerochaete sordida]|uniref:DUF6593 domain-containing protein n=1 Tax=Phanerochaete sordida TaxID=48140 RepID=A0A9P3GJ84_9APHY|nr:hypothetical protein PsYK624_107340 [Phanerochaete sordida]